MIGKRQVVFVGYMSDGGGFLWVGCRGWIDGDTFMGFDSYLLREFAGFRRLKWAIVSMEQKPHTKIDSLLLVFFSLAGFQLPMGVWDGSVRRFRLMRIHPLNIHNFTIALTNLERWNHSLTPPLFLRRFKTMFATDSFIIRWERNMIRYLYQFRYSLLNLLSVEIDGGELVCALVYVSVLSPLLIQTW